MTVSLADLRLDDGRLKALRNLDRKQKGEDVGFINIADAQALTELGLALRTPQGWRITDLGARLLVETSGPGAAPATTVATAEGVWLRH